MSNIFEEVTKYRLKVEKDGKSLVDVPGILALPGLLIAPKLSITGLVAAPLLGCKVHVESEDGKAVDVEGTVRKAAETVMDTAGKAARTIREEMDKAWEAISAEDPEETAEEPGETEDEPVSEDVPAPEEAANREIVEELEKQAENDIPVIQVKPDDSSRE